MKQKRSTAEVLKARKYRKKRSVSVINFAKRLDVPPTFRSPMFRQLLFAYRKWARALKDIAVNWSGDGTLSDLYDIEIKRDFWPGYTKEVIS